MSFSYTLTGPIGQRGIMGLIALQSDETIEQDMRRMVPETDIALYTTRVPSAPEVNGDTLGQMARDLPAAAALLPPSIDFDVVGYGCTSGSSVIGAERVAALVQGACTTRAVTNPMTALIAYAQAHGLTRLAFLSPYIAQVSETLRSSLAQAGIETPVFGTFAEAQEAKVARIDPASIHSAAVELGRDPHVDAVFCSCTNLRCLDVLDPIAQDIAKPALSSNQVLGWHMRSLAGGS